MQLRYNFRIYPTPGQRVSLARAFGCARVVYNDALAIRRAAHEAGEAWIPNGEVMRRVTVEVADTRRDWHHKLSTTLIRENQAIYVEDLCVAGIARTRMAKSVHDAGWSQFVKMLEYKATRYGRHLGKINRWFPSTRMCGICKVVGPEVPLHIRSWTCACGATHDRDINAARNILAAGRAERPNDCGSRVGPPSVVAPRREAGTRRRPAHTSQ
jgi:putative transposase